MAKGSRVVDGATLVPTSTRIEAETKEMLDALVQVQKLDGCRDLLNKMLEVYVKEYPEDAKKAKQLIEMLK